MKKLKAWATAAAMLALTGATQAALVSLGDGTVKDTNTNLIWLQDWNVNGLANWGMQKAWAETALDGFAGSNDWRLPEISEYAALFSAYGDLRAVTNFTNVVTTNSVYWSNTEIGTLDEAWFFQPNNGVTSVIYQSFRYYAVAVRRGDATPSVPEPQTLALALLALGATVVARRRRSS